MEYSDINTTRLFLSPTTGGEVEIRVPPDETVEGLKWTISRMFNIQRERIRLLYKNKELKHGFLGDYSIGENSCITLLPSMESGLSFNKKEKGVMQALESLTESQISEFLSGRAPLVLAMRLGDHMMFIQLQLSSAQQNAKRHRPSPVQLPSSERLSVKDHQEVPSPTYIPVTDDSAISSPTYVNGSNGIPYNLHQFRSFPQSEKNCPSPDYSEDATKSSIPPPQGAVIESVQNIGQGMYCGTFSGTIDPSINSVEGKPRRDLSTIVHILNDLLGAAPQYRQHCYVHQQHNHTSSNLNLMENNHERRADDRSDNANIRSKVRHLKMMMDERKQRRKSRRTMQNPYQWQKKQYRDSTKEQRIPSKGESEDNNVPIDSYKNLEKETVAV